MSSQVWIRPVRSRRWLAAAAAVALAPTLVCDAVLPQSGDERVDSPRTEDDDATRGSAQERAEANDRWARPAPPEWTRRLRHSPYGRYYPQPIPWYAPHPWYAHPSSQYKDFLYPPPVAREPRLGLGYNYPYAFEMGLRLPPDLDPHAIPDLPHFVGVVGAAKAALREGGVEEASVPGERTVLDLMRQGEFRAAGKLLAREYARREHPRYPALLAEALFALGKYDLAELTLRQALSSSEGLLHLPGDVAEHFPTAGDFASRLEVLLNDSESVRKHGLLVSYLLLHSDDPAEGIARLERRLAGAPDDVLASRLYRRYLEVAF